MAGGGPVATPSVRFASNVGAGVGGAGVPMDAVHVNNKPTTASKINMISNDHLDPTSQTYASLIQQYLAVLCHDNATFYAERMVAHNPTDLVSAYLLATCHYRSGNVKRARSVLLERGVASLATGSSTDDNAAAATDENGEVRGGGGKNSVQSASVYLLAKCCSDLRLYAEAEDVLLRPCRQAYRVEHPNANNGGNNNDAEEGATSNNPDAEFDDWILTSSPCPIPNGAAGLALLGYVCRRSDRLGRAAKYYRMSLKLDPMMWTSYEALCEMGAANTDVDDPTVVFGVVPKSIQPEDVGFVDPDHDPDADGAEAPTSESSPSFISVGASPGVVGGGAPTPMSLDGGGGAGGGGGGGHDDSSSSLLPATSLFPRSAGGGGRRGGTGAAGAAAAAGPFDAPDLTPIQRRGGGGGGGGGGTGNSRHQYATRSRQRHAGGGPPASAAAASGASAGGQGQGHPTPAPRQRQKTRPDSAMMTSAQRTPMTGDDVVARARTVASRLYYGPSPETTPPHVLGAGLDYGSAIKAPPSIKAAWSVGKSGKKGRGRRAPPLLGGLGTEMDYSSASSTVTGAGGSSRGRLSFGSAASGSVRTPLGERALFAGDEEDGRDQSYAEEAAMEDRNNDGAEEMPPPAPRPPASAGLTKVGVVEEDEEIEDECGTGEDGGVQEILELLCILGAAQRKLCEYKCRDALRVFYKLPHSQFYTGWVQHQVGRAYFEMSDYQNAQKALETMQRIEPHRMKGLEVLSTALWHLKKEVELSNLAQRAIDFDRQSAEAWCVVGNCFSLQKEHETALTFFRRSVRLDPSFTYSHTLSGHEYVANEDFDKAAACYRDALRADDRHYNAWYGLGAIYFRQEKHDLAEYHFRKALTINPQSSVLRCHLGMAQHATGRPMDALDTLAGALLIDPRNPQARYQRATIWMAMDRPEEALAELERVRDAAPREASVHFAMGRVLKRLGKPEGAMRCFLTALDLDSKDNNLIKAAMDRLDEPDVDEDVSEF